MAATEIQLRAGGSWRDLALAGTSLGTAVMKAPLAPGVTVPLKI